MINANKLNKKIKLSFIIPVYNEEKILNANIKKLLVFCEKNNINSEIIICENGSTDKTKEILTEISQNNVKSIFLKKKGLGNAYREGIKLASQPFFYFTGIDFPFGYKNILDS